MDLKSIQLILITFISYLLLNNAHIFLYSRYNTYVCIYDFLKLPYHQFKIKFIMSKFEVIVSYYYVKKIKNKNYNLLMFEHFLIRRLYNDGYDDKSIEDMFKSIDKMKKSNKKDTN